MADISKIDTNLAPVSVSEGMEFFDVRKPPFRLYGLYEPTTPGVFRRCLLEVAKNTSPGVEFLHTNTTGARVRFRTNSSRIAIKAEFPSLCVMPHQAITGSSGFDLHANGMFVKSFVPPIDYQGGFMPHFHVEGGYSSQIDLGYPKSRDILIHFPTYNDVTNLFIGVEAGAELTWGDEYAITKPVVFYGSSITHGCAATKPGNAYPNLLSRWLDADILNIAFSGNAKGEDAMAEYIATLDMSAFVYDYDHNAPTVEHLQNTHSRMFSIIREKNPELPIIMASRPNRNYDDHRAERKAVILQTVADARAKGDNNVYFVDGETMFDLLDREMCTVDGSHPTDIGFYCMAKAFEPVLREILYR